LCSYILNVTLNAFSAAGRLLLRHAAQKVACYILYQAYNSLLPTS